MIFEWQKVMNYFIPKYIEKKNYSKVKTIISYAFLTQVITGSIIAIFLFLWADYLSLHYFKSAEASNILKIFCLYFLWINIFQIFNWFFWVVQNTFLNRFTEFSRMIFILISILIVSYLDIWNIITFSYAWIWWLYFWIVFVIYFFYTRYYKKFLKEVPYTFSKKLFKKIFSYAIVVFIAAQAATLLSQMDMQMIIYLLNTEQAWYYSNYLSIIWIPFMLIWPIFWLLFPVFSELYAKKDYTQIN